MNPPNDYEIIIPEDPDEPINDPRTDPIIDNPLIRDSKPFILKEGSIIVGGFFILSTIVFVFVCCGDNTTKKIEVTKTLA